MKTFLKIFLLVLLSLVAIKLLPVLLVPFGVLALVVGFVVALVTGGAAAAAGVGFALLGILLAAGLVVLAALAPIWILVLIVTGAIALVRRCLRARA